jgi:hypothetical protein
MARVKVVFWNLYFRGSDDRLGYIHRRYGSRFCESCTHASGDVQDCGPANLPLTRAGENPTPQATLRIQMENPLLPSRLAQVSESNLRLLEQPRLIQ